MTDEQHIWETAYAAAFAARSALAPVMRGDATTTKDCAIYAKEIADAAVVGAAWLEAEQGKCEDVT